MLRNPGAGNTNNPDSSKNLPANAFLTELPGKAWIAGK
jgi:hypothetical protein